MLAIHRVQEHERAVAILKAEADSRLELEAENRVTSCLVNRSAWLAAAGPSDVGQGWPVEL